jgi:hypothetical protein
MRREFRGFAEADDAWKVFCSGAALAFMGAAEEKRLDLQAAAHVEDSDAERRIYFVAGKCEQMAAERSHIERKF